MPQSPVLLDFTDSRPFDIDQIHQATGFYTVDPKVNAISNLLDLPAVGTSILDPGAGSGACVLAALACIPLRENDVATAVQRVRGYELHSGAVREVRNNIYFHLRSQNWGREPAMEAAANILEVRDFPIEELPEGKFDVIAVNRPICGANGCLLDTASNTTSSSPVRLKHTCFMPTSRNAPASSHPRDGLVLVTADATACK